MKEAESSKQPWSLKVENLTSFLGSGPDGITEQEAARRLKIYGKNIFQSREKKTIIGIFLKQLGSPLIFILIVAGIITIIMGEWIEAIVISGAVLINSGLGFYREYSAENTLEKLSSFIKDRSRVIRGGREEEIDSETLVPGDLIKLSYGARIPADARVISVNNLKVNESILTGESKSITKNEKEVPGFLTVAERTNMIHAGTLVVDGFGIAIVVSTGHDTEIGKIAGLVSSVSRAKTPIQKSLTSLAWVIFGLVLVIVVGIFALGFFRGEPILEMMMISVAVAVGAVPEALPIALTIILSIGVERIANKKGVARTLMAAETLGSTTLIMTDKTGTLTEANMKLVDIYTTEELKSGDFGNGEYNQEDNFILKMALTNVDVLIENPEETMSSWVFKGKPFEVNIVRTARDNGINISSIIRDVSPIIIPFNSTHKFSVALAEDGEYTVMGAPDILVSKANLPKEISEKISDWIIKASQEGKRLIALGKMKNERVPDINQVKDISFMGILAFHDPIRPEVPAAIKKIESLGTKIVMITGDLPGTAISVAKDLGWNISSKDVLTGDDLRIISDENLLKRIPNVKIFARVTPEDKLRIGLLYKKLGEVVAMTGDGVNDAPALKAMDIGVSLGSGSDVAKSAADLVLLDDNFEIISMAIEEGRRILANIRKAFVYLMSTSLDEVFVIGGSLVVGIAFPLTALQIIWVNLFTGSLPALAFAYDEDFDHDRFKKHTLKSIFTKEINFLTFGIGIMSSVLLFIMYYLLLEFGVPTSLARSVFFVCFTAYILVIAFSFRSIHKPLFSYPVFSNKRLNLSIAFAFILLIMTMTVPFFRNLFDIDPLPFSWLWFVILWLVLNIFFVEGAKYFFRKHKRKSKFVLNQIK